MGSNYPGLPSVGELRTFREKIRGKMSYFFMATTNLAIAPAGPPQEPQLQIDARADFLALELMADSNLDHIVPAVDFYTFEISNSSSGRAYQSAPLHSQATLGTGQRPHYLAVPILFQAGSSIALRVIALNAASTYAIRIVIGGVKIYRE